MLIPVGHRESLLTGQEDIVVWRKLITVLYVTLWIVTVISILFHLIELRITFSRQPVVNYVLFIIWAATLSMWSYRRLRNAPIELKTKYISDSVLPGNRIESRQYEALIYRHGLLFAGMALIWYMLIMGDPHPNEYGEFTDSALAVIAHRYLGYVSIFEGFRSFEFYSLAHRLIFYLLSCLPLIQLALSAWLIFSMANRRIIRAKSSYEKDPDSYIPYL
jgi:hypothetical protein